MRKVILLLLCAAALFAQDWKNPAFWGLPKGAYIPTDENCMGGTFAKGHNKHKQFDFETCAIVWYPQEQN